MLQIIFLIFVARGLKGALPFAQPGRIFFLRGNVLLLGSFYSMPTEKMSDLSRTVNIIDDQKTLSFTYTVKFEPPPCAISGSNKETFKPLFRPSSRSFIQASFCSNSVKSGENKIDDEYIKDIMDNIPMLCHLRDVSHEANDSMKRKNANPYFMKQEWVGSELEELFRTNPDIFKNLNLVNITHFRRLSSGLDFEFLCVWKNGAGDHKITWQRYSTIREHPHFTRLVSSSQWDTQSILNDERHRRVLHYELVSNLKPADRKRAHANFSKYPSTSQEDCIYCVKELKPNTHRKNKKH